MSEPAISIVVPSYNRPAELGQCLAGLAAQCASPNDFEVVVVDDGSEADYALVCSPYADRLNLRLRRTRNRGVSAARNDAILAAEAPLLILLDDDLAPEPTLVADCLRFHRMHPDEGDLMLLHFEIDPSVARSPLVAHLAQGGPLFEFPPRDGVYGHEYFWGGALTCKRRLFDRGLFRPGLDATEDTELGARLATSLPLRIHYEKTARLRFVRDLRIEAVERSEYLLAYHRYFRRFDVGWLAGAYGSEARYHEPQRFLVHRGEDLTVLHTAARELETLIQGPLAPDRDALHRDELRSVYGRLIDHAMASGWRDAALGRPPTPAPHPVARAAAELPWRLPAARWRTGQPPEPPLLSAVLICRNERQHIEGCLASLAQLADEVVVVDTGSADGTIDIARACGAVVAETVWGGDFSAARNRSLDLATGDWVLYIDADERVLPVDPTPIRAQLTDPSLAGLRVLLQSHAGLTPFYEIRLFRRDPSVRFEGVIHETVWPSLLTSAAANGQSIGVSPLRLRHLGYSGDQSAKHARNLPLLERSIEETPEKIFNWTHLATVYSALGRNDDAERAWVEATTRARQAADHPLQDSIAFGGYLQWLQSQGRPVDRALDEALRLYPGNYFFRWLDGHRLLNRGKHGAAAERFEEVLGAADPTRRDHTIGYPESLFGSWTEVPLAASYLELGRYAEAAGLYGRLEREDPTNLEFRVKRIYAESREQVP